MISDRITLDATLHRHSKGSKNASGDYVDTYTDHAIKVEIQQSSATEFRDGRRVLSSDWQCWVTPDETISGHDQITANGVRYSIEGKPFPVRHPRLGTQTHWLLRLKEVK